MAQWLEMITLKVASENPANTHAQPLGSTPCLFPQYQLVGSLFFSLSLSFFFSLSLSMSWSENRVFELLRLRAAVFVNLVTMRKVMDHGGNGHVQLAPCNLEILQKSNYLFHSAHNCPLTLICHTCVFVVGLLLLQQ